MRGARENDGALEWTSGQEVVRIEPWGADSLRIRAGFAPLLDDLPSALGERPGSGESPVIDIGDSLARITHGALCAEVDPEGMLRFVDADGAELLAERPAHFWWPGPRLYGSGSGHSRRMEQCFRAYEGERIYGLGQHTHGLLDQKGTVLDLVQRNAEVSIPFLLSSRGYGFLWNNPAVGRVEFAHNGTRWIADSTRQLDYWVTTGGTPAELLGHYAEATGHPPMLPEWAAGFWQSKLRYRSQEELLEVVREYRRRELPLSVIVSDFFHWPHLGEWRFDPVEYPDPAAMMRELDEAGVRLMVSIWPSVNPLSENFERMSREGMLVGTEAGVPYHAPWRDKGFDVAMPVAFYDPTNPRARRFVWDRARENYYDLGVRVWWLDACEPEVLPGTPENLRFEEGPGQEVFNLYPLRHAQGFHDGMRAEGETEVVSLCRSAWAGSQRYGAALWSGDIDATFESLRAQVRAGLNVALSGIPWWTTDIGGFHGGDPDSEYFRELVVRWFQYGVFCPLFRLHGNRDPRMPLGPEMTGGPNEVWSFGQRAYELIREMLFLRERLRPYLMEQMRVAHERGLPPMRPLFVDHPDDERAWEVDDEFLLGPDVLVAPVTEYGARERSVHLPGGNRWTGAWDGQVFEGGTTTTVPAPLESVPVFLREGATVGLGR
ncbi:family 31 glucosidase [Actinopolyspora erythraea]|uniref:Family 31 glucosidase n=1 Tax=Actinopolyspora erythraea TaxID=414996 RepID=A0A099D7R7_9ACTN|nr:glycoside hydrolase family 31 protein [Actinopolyspora erythraea]ASU78339.1 family 31 glucosidase [Actinopolyspora erythraea]KGI81971.1 family 31 glucosidase [Actinopolyspora erythraea]